MIHSLPSSRGIEPGHVDGKVARAVEETQAEMGSPLTAEGVIASRGYSMAMHSLLYLADVEERVAALEEDARARGAKLLSPSVIMLGRYAEQGTKKRARWDYVRKDWSLVG